MSSSSLIDLVQDLASGAIKIIDLTATLEPSTPTLKLPTEYGWGVSWPFSIEEISRYDERGPAWYWNNFKCGEHTGTHFDAPIHWVTGKDHNDHATDSLPVESFIAPACVIDASNESSENPDFLMSVAFIKKWEAQHGQMSSCASAACSYNGRCMFQRLLHLRSRREWEGLVIPTRGGLCL